MQEREFDRFADEYLALHAKNIQVSGETPEFFAAYKVADTAELLAEKAYPDALRWYRDLSASFSTPLPRW